MPDEILLLKPRVVYDTNVLISALFGGVPFKALDAWLSGHVLCVMTPAIKAEILETMQEFEESKEKDLILSALASERGVFPCAPSWEPGVSRDPEDDKFIFAAHDAAADCVVSGDKDLLVLGDFEGIPILTPRQFLEWFKKRIK